MTILFPNNPLRPGEVDVDYREERDAAVAAGFAVALFDHERLAEGDADRAARAIRPADRRTDCWMRGWMVSGSQYGALEAALRAKGYRLIVDADAYAEAHYLPLAYRHLEGFTPASVWTDAPDTDAAWAAYQRLADGDTIVKDWVKSAKHRWDEACFIPAGAARERVERTLAALQADRGGLFEHGFVFRRFVPLVADGRDMRGHPASEELRLFYFDGSVLVPPRPNHALPADVAAEVDARARRFRSRFLTLDVAPLTDGTWTIVESGDAGVSGLPVSLMADVFYDALRRRVTA